MTDANDREKRIDAMLSSYDELLHLSIRDLLERRRRAGISTITRAVIDQAFEQTEEQILRNRDQLEEDGKSSVIACVERRSRDPEYRETFYRRYGC